MNLYLIQRQNGDGKGHWDAYWGHVIRADNESEVRDIAASYTANEGPDIWYNPKTTVEILALGVDGPAGVVLSDFNAG